MTSVFISYRREDTTSEAGRLTDHFIKRWGRDRIFLDIDSIPPGSDFAHSIEDTLHKRPVVIVLIGKKWGSSVNEIGERRLDNSLDFVRMEVRLALSKKLKVIPVLIGEAKMPSANELPEDIRNLSNLNAMEISERHFSRDIALLMRNIGKPRITLSAIFSPIAIWVVILVAAIEVLVWFQGTQSDTGLPGGLQSLGPSSNPSSMPIQVVAPPNELSQENPHPSEFRDTPVKSELLQWLIVSNPTLSPTSLLEVKLSTQSSKIRAFGIFAETGGHTKRINATYGKSTGGISLVYRIPADTPIGHHTAKIYVQEISSRKEEIHPIDYEIVPLPETKTGQITYMPRKSL